MKKTYQEKKEEIRNQAVAYSLSFANDTVYYWSDIFEIESYFSKMGKRYGLLKEFHENAIC